MLRLRPTEITLSPAEIHRAKERMSARQQKQSDIATTATQRCPPPFPTRVIKPLIRPGPERSRDESLVCVYPHARAAPRIASQSVAGLGTDLPIKVSRERHDSVVSGLAEPKLEDFGGYSEDTLDFETTSESSGDELEAFEYSPSKHSIGFSRYPGTQPRARDDQDELLDGQQSPERALNPARPPQPSNGKHDPSRMRSLRDRAALPRSPLRVSEAAMASSSPTESRLPAPQNDANLLVPTIPRPRSYRHRPETNIHEGTLTEWFSAPGGYDTSDLRFAPMGRPASQQRISDLDPIATMFGAQEYDALNSLPPGRQHIQATVVQALPSSQLTARGSVRFSANEPESSLEADFLARVRWQSTPPAPAVNEISALNSQPSEAIYGTGSQVSQSYASPAALPYSHTHIEFCSTTEPSSSDALNVSSGRTTLQAPTPPTRISSIVFKDHGSTVGSNGPNSSSPTAVEEALRGCSSPLDRFKEETLLRLQALSITSTPPPQASASGTQPSADTPPPPTSRAQAASESRIAMRTLNDPSESHTPPRTPTRAPRLPPINGSLTAPPGTRPRNGRPARSRRLSRTPIWSTNEDSEYSLFTSRNGLSPRRQPRRRVNDEEENLQTMPPGLQEARRVWAARSESRDVMDTTPPPLTRFERFL